MIGIDAVDVERFRGLLERVPTVEARLFTAAESAYCHTRADPVLHLAGTLAAKEAVIKAVSLGPLVSWCRRIEIDRGAKGAPEVKVVGIPDREMKVSISHDGGLAVAVAVVKEEEAVISSSSSAADGLRPNQRLVRYLASGLQPQSVRR